MMKKVTNIFKNAMKCEMILREKEKVIFSGQKFVFRCLYPSLFMAFIDYVMHVL